jgi:pilus assembly protein Flp/PilA
MMGNFFGDERPEPINGSGRILFTAEAIMDVTSILLTIGALIVGAAGAWFVAQRSNTASTKEWIWLLDDVVPVLVKAAEQLYKNGNGAQKLDYVLKQADAYLHRYGMDIDPELIRAWIEATVHDLYPHDETTVTVSDPRGQGLIEYSLILVLIAVVVIAVLSLLGPLVANVFSTINASIGG